MLSEKLAGNKAESKRFFEILWQVAETGYLGISHKGVGGTFPTSFFPISDLDTIVGHILSLAEKTDVYHSVGLYREKPTKGSRGLETQIGILPGFWYEQDCAGGTHKKKGKKPTTAEGMDFLLSLPLKPSLVISSGGGLHAYWLFNEALTINNGDFESVKACSKGWQTFIGREQGWKGWKEWDNTSGLNWILRPAGTFNHKSDPVGVGIMEETSFRYELYEFGEYAGKEEPKEAPAEPSPGEDGAIDIDSIEIPYLTKRAITEQSPKGRRSETLASALTSLIMARLNDNQIIQIFEDHPQGIGEKYFEKGHGREKWLRDEIKRSRDFRTPEPETRPPYPPLTPDQTRVQIESEPDPPEAIITYNDRPILIRGIVAMIAAAGGTGKTFLLQQLANAMAAGTGLGPLKAAAGNEFNVLMLCGEDPQEVVNRRLWNVSRGTGTFPQTLHIASTVGRLGPLMKLDGNNPAKAPAFHWLRETIQNHTGLDLLILDPKSRWYGLDENSNDHATQWIGCLESLATEFNITILFSHHVSKAADGKMESGMNRGASAITDGVRWQAGMTRMSDATGKRYGITDTRNYVEFDITKTNYAAGLPSRFVFERTENGTLRYASLEIERKDKLLKIVYEAIAAEPAKFSKRDVVKGTASGADFVFNAIALEFPSFKKKEMGSLIDEMLKGNLLEEKEATREGEDGGAGMKKRELHAVPLDEMDLGQIRF